MKINIKTQVCCSYDNLKKYLPGQYISLVDRRFYGEVVNFVSFSADKSAVTGSEVIKAQRRLSGTDLKTFYFARCFTSEASELIAESNGAAFTLADYMLWTDESYNILRGGKKLSG